MQKWAMGRTSDSKVRSIRDDQHSRRGLTLTEVVVSTALVGILIVSSIKSSTFFTNESVMQSERLIAEQLADALLAELSVMPYADPDGATDALGAEVGEVISNRSRMDDVDDVHGWSSTPPENRFGDALAGYDGWTRAIEVAHLNPVTLASAAVTTGLKRIEVTVTTSSGIEIVKQALVCDPGIIDPTSSRYDKQINWSGIQFTDSSGNPREIGAGVRNPIYSSLALPRGGGGS